MRRSARALYAVLVLALVGQLLVWSPWSGADPVAIAAAARHQMSSGSAGATAQDIAAVGSTVHVVWQDHGMLPGGRGAIALRSSFDGGRTFTSPKVLSASWNEGRRPAIAASGSHVYVAWVEATAPSGPDQGDWAVMLVSSRDGGRSFSAPMRVDEVGRGDSSVVDVAADGPWATVAWNDLSGSPHAVTTADGGFSLSRLPALDGPGADVEIAVARHGDVVAATWVAGDQVVVASSTDRGLTFGAPVAVSEPGRPSALPGVVASPHGIDVVWSSRSDRPLGGGRYETDVHAARSADRGTTFSAPERLGVTGDLHPAGAASIAVTGDVVAASWPDVSGDGAMVATRAGAGGWGPAQMVTGPIESHTSLTGPSRPARMADGTAATFTWSVPDRFGADADGDGLVDYDQSVSYLNPDHFEVHLDGCASVAGDGSALTYQWSVDGTVLADDACQVTALVPDEGVYEVALTVTAADGGTDTRTRTIEVQDLLVVSVGDSVASGEGNPDVPGDGWWPWSTSARWQDRQCNRSALSGPAQAAIQLEGVSPRSSVTFLHLACSGASIEGPDVSTGGLLTPYAGINPDEGSVLDPQLSRLESLVLEREVDALFISIGANDLHFSEVVAGCIVHTDCHDPTGPIATAFAERLAALPERYARLAQEIERLGIPPERVHISEYFDPTTDERGEVDLRCVADLGGELAGISLEEAAWARANVVAPLNEAVRTAAETHGWSYVGGIADAFTGHGYCSTDSWIVTLGDSFRHQADENGSFHPNGPGHQHYAGRLAASVGLRDLPEPQDPADPSDPPAEDHRGDLYLGWVSARSATGRPQAHVTTLSVADGVATPRAVVRVSDAPAQLGADVPTVAATGKGAWAAWTQLMHDGGTTDAFQVFAAPAVIGPPDLTAHGAWLVQAADDATWLVAGKPTAILVDAESTATLPRPVFIGYEVTDETGAVVERGTRLVDVAPGRQPLALPLDEPTLAAHVDRELRVTITLDAAEVIPEPDESDNVATSEALAVTTSRGASVLVVRAGSTCHTATTVDNAAAPYVRATFPVVPETWAHQVSCVATPWKAPTTRAEANALLHQVERYAAHSGHDHVVAVTPSGAMPSFNVAGLAYLGSSDDDGEITRGVLLDAGAAPSVMAHELGHNHGLDHVDDQRAVGYWVERGLHQSGSDFMAPSSRPQEWISGGSFDQLLTRLRSTTGAGQPAGLAAGGSILVSGTVDDDGIHLDPWYRDAVPADAEATGGDVAVVEQRDASGALLRRSTVPLVATAHGTGGRGFAARVPDAGAAVAEIAVSVDGHRRVERAVPARPPAVTAAVEQRDAALHLGEDVEVRWTAETADSDDVAEVIVEVRTVDGRWQPVAVTAGETSAVFTLTHDLAGQAIEVRVTVTDGVNSAATVVGPLPTTTDPAPPAERMVYLFGEPRSGALDAIGTAWADGTGHRPLVDQRTGARIRGEDPTWSPDGSRILFHAGPRLDPDATYEEHELSTWYSVAPDGSDLRRVTHGQLLTSPELTRCARWMPDGRHLVAVTNPSRDGYEIVRIAVETGAREVLARIPVDLNCPAVSPDGQHLAFRSDDGLQVLDVAAGEVRTIHRRAHISNPSWTADGRILYYDYGIFDDWANRLAGPFIQAVRPDGTGVETVTEFVGWSVGPDPQRGYQVFSVELSADGEHLHFGTDRTNDHHGFRYGSLAPTFDEPDLRDVSLEPFELRLACRSALDGSDRRCLRDPEPVWSGTLQAWEGGIEHPDWSGTPVPPPPLEPPPAPAPVPEVTVGGPYETTEGRALELRGGGSAAARPGVRAAWDLDDDGDFDDAHGLNPTVRLGRGTWPIALRLEDEDGRVWVDHGEAFVLAVAATILPPDGLTAVAGEPFRLEVPFTDPGTDPHVAEVTTRHGRTEPELHEGPGGGYLSAPLTFPEPGREEVTVRVCDAYPDGGYGHCAYADLEVEVLPPDATTTTTEATTTTTEDPTTTTEDPTTTTTEDPTTSTTDATTSTTAGPAPTVGTVPPPGGPSSTVPGGSGPPASEPEPQVAGDGQRRRPADPGGPPADAPGRRRPDGPLPRTGAAGAGTGLLGLVLLLTGATILGARHRWIHRAR